MYRHSISPRMIALFLWSAAVVMQSLWWFQAQDLIPVALAISGGCLGINMFLRREILARYPISTSMMLGYTSLYFLLPPAATLLEGKPLTHNLDHPILVFVHAFVCFLLLVAGHGIYRHWRAIQDLRWLVVERVYTPVGLFRTPSNLHLLAMGCVGLSASYTQVFAGGGVQEELLGAGNKFMQALFILAYLPFVMLVREAMGGKTRLSRNWLFVTSIYTALLLIVSMARNSRTVFLLGIASIVLVYLYQFAIGVTTTRVLSTRNVMLAAVGTAVVLGPVADVATSMVIVRGERTDISAVKLVRRTFETFADKEAIRDRRLASREALQDWDERYVDNQFMARLANPKYADNSIDLALAMNGSDRRVFRKLELERSLSIFPRPVLSALGLSVDKDFVGASSGGDLMLYAVTGDSSVLGVFRAGSICGSGYAVLGWAYPLALALVAQLLFALADGLTSRKVVAWRDGKAVRWLPVLSPMAIVGFFTWFAYFTSAARGLDSFSGLTNYILRGWLEVVVIYAFAYWSTFFLVRPFDRVTA